MLDVIIMDQFFVTVDTAHQKREKQKARELRATHWWKLKISQGICYYCGQKFDADDLSMDHKVPIARGGRSVKSNVVVACKSCNSKKSHQTPVEMILNQVN